MLATLKNTRSREHILHVCGTCMLCASVCLSNSIKSFVSCQALAGALQQNSSLTNLDLYRNDIGDVGAQVWCLVWNGIPIIRMSWKLKGFMLMR